MAKLISPLFSTEARGKVGGLIYNTWRGVNYVKSFCSPAQPRSARVLQIRAWMVNLVRQWKSLTDAQRLTWTNYAITHTEVDFSGSPVRLTGLNWFCRCSIRLLDQTKAIVLTAPITDPPASVAAAVATPGAGTMSIAFTAFGGTDTTVEAWAVQGRGAGVSPKITMAKFKQRGPGETTPLVVTGLAAGFCTIFLRAISETTGLCSMWVSVSGIVT